MAQVEKHVERMWRKMKNLHLVKSAAAYNAILLLYERNNRYSDIRKRYVEMALSNVKPDALTYAVLLKCQDMKKLSICQLEAKAAVAMKQLEKARDELPACQVLDMARVYGYLGDVDAIERMRLRLEQDQGQVPHSSVIIEAFARAGAFQKAESVFQRLEQPGTQDYVAMAEAYMQAGRLEKAEKILKSMTEAGEEAGQEIYNSLALAWLKGGAARDASRVMDAALQSGSATKALYPSILAILYAYAKSGDVEAAEELVSRFKGADFADAKLHHALLRVYLNAQVPIYQAEAKVEATFSPEELFR